MDNIPGSLASQQTGLRAAGAPVERTVEKQDRNH